MKTEVVFDLFLPEKDQNLIQKKINEIWDKSQIEQESNIALRTNIFFADKECFKETFAKAKEKTNALVFFIYESTEELSAHILRYSDGFICKPFNEEQLAEEIREVYVKRFQSTILSPANSQVEKVTFSGIKKDVMFSISKEDIAYIKADGSISNIHYRTSQEADKLKMKRLNHPIAECEELLSAGLFYRIHRKFLVNCEWINLEECCKQMNFITLISGQELPVARRRRSAFIEWCKENAVQKLKSV